MARILAGVVGFPVEHSLSPEIFAVLSRKTGIPLEYRKLAISSRAFGRELVSAARQRRFHGWNVTLPHKEKAASRVDRLDPAARVLGAVNVIRFSERNVSGYNTDVLGVRETLRRNGFRSSGKSAVVYGAGGGAAATVFALGAEGIGQVVLVNRTFKKARALASKMSAAFPRTRFVVARESTVPADADLYVNATPLGMKGFPKSPGLPRLGRDPVLVFDLVYRPLETSFLMNGRKQGARTVNGLEMLVTQAIATWEIWFGKLPPELDRGQLRNGIRKGLLRKLRPASATGVSGVTRVGGVRR